jgi:hypothetical protein
LQECRIFGFGQNGLLNRFLNFISLNVPKNVYNETFTFSIAGMPAFWIWANRTFVKVFFLVFIFIFIFFVLKMFLMKHFFLFSLAGTPDS